MFPSARTATLRDDSLAREKDAGCHHPAEKPASFHYGILEIGMDCVQYVTRLADGREFKNGAVLKSESIADCKPLNLDTSHRDILTHDARSDGIALGGKLLDQFEILNRDGTVRPAMFLMIVVISDETVRRDLRPVDRSFRHAARRNAYGDNYASQG